jgi:hypothetical protein
MVDFEYLHVEFVADVDDFLDPADILGGQVLFRNKSFATGDVLHHCAATHDSGHLAGEFASHRNLVGEGFDHCDRILYRLAVVAANKNLSVLLDIDRSAGGTRDLLDHSASWADDRTNLFWIDVNRRHRRSGSADSITRLRNGFDDNVKNLKPSVLGLR